MTKIEYYMRNAEQFVRSGRSMFDSIDMIELEKGKQGQLLTDCAGQLEQAARELRRLEGHCDAIRPPMTSKIRHAR